MGDGGCFIQRVESDRKGGITYEGKRIEARRVLLVHGSGGGAKCCDTDTGSWMSTLFDSDEGQSVRLTADRVELYLLRSVEAFAKNKERLRRWKY